MKTTKTYTVYLEKKNCGGTFGIGKTEEEAMNIATLHWLETFGDYPPDVETVKEDGKVITETKRL